VIEHELERHVHGSHSELVPVLPTVKRTSLKTVSMTEKVNCLLCTAKVTIGTLQKHLGAHQQQLALFTLPANINEGSASGEEDYTSRIPLEMQQDMNDDTSSSDVNSESVKDLSSEGVSITYESTLPRTSQSLIKYLREDELFHTELSSASVPEDYMEDANSESLGSHDADGDTIVSDVSGKLPTKNIAIENLANIGSDDFRNTFTIGAELSDEPGEMDITSRGHSRSTNVRPLAQSADKQLLFARLGLNERSHKLLLQDAQKARDSLSADVYNLTNQSR